MKPKGGTDDPLSIGEIIESPEGARYRVLRRIGAGGYSVVYEVVEEKTGGRYAMKVLQLARASDARSVERARREGPILFRLQHPNIVRVHAYAVRGDGLIWLVLDLLVGRTLRQLQAAMGNKIPVPLVLEIVTQVCATLAVVHRFELVHRDVKPENIHIREDGGLVRLFDLGAAEIETAELATTGGFTVGTVAYMSPEQALAERDIDARSDVFSIGTLLYELLSGVHPFEHEGQISNVYNQEIGRKILLLEPVPLRKVAPFVPPELEHVVHKCLRKERNERYPSAEILYRILIAATKDYLATHSSVSLREIMALLKEQAPVTGEVPALVASPNPFLLSSEERAGAGDPALVTTERQSAHAPAPPPELAPRPASELAPRAAPERAPVDTTARSAPPVAKTYPATGPLPPGWVAVKDERSPAPAPAVPLRAPEVPARAPEVPRFQSANADKSARAATKPATAAEVSSSLQSAIRMLRPPCSPTSRRRTYLCPRGVHEYQGAAHAPGANR